MSGGRNGPQKAGLGAHNGPGMGLYGLFNSPARLIEDAFHYAAEVEKGVEAP